MQYETPMTTPSILIKNNTIRTILIATTTLPLPRIIRTQHPPPAAIPLFALHHITHSEACGRNDQCNLRWYEDVQVGSYKALPLSKSYGVRNPETEKMYLAVACPK
mmetsp:Transcript_7997/g.11681  ORF Transcript_7997/g.11681 Transcript_7997/m.11681 type:complete len:106 (-) Transcript_7997:56-373(-)